MSLTSWRIAIRLAAQILLVTGCITFQAKLLVPKNIWIFSHFYRIFAFFSHFFEKGSLRIFSALRRSKFASLSLSHSTFCENWIPGQMLKKYKVTWISRSFFILKKTYGHVRLRSLPRTSIAGSLRLASEKRMKAAMSWSIFFLLLNYSSGFKSTRRKSRTS